MKYVYFISVVLFTLLRKVVGLVAFWFALPFRGYARNVVYNYRLNHGKYLKRLWERPIRLSEDMSVFIIDPYHGTEGGFIRCRDVSHIEYFLVYWFIWGWLDDDTNYDTMCLGFTEKVLTGEHPKGWFTKLFRKQLEGAVVTMTNSLYGNSFDLGDRRACEPLFSFPASLLWLMRNTAYNFKYSQYETLDESRVFYFEIFNRAFGWKPEGIICGRQNYTLVFFETIPEK
ncbi:hypothetical protein GR7B_00234 [Vibrio phage vB_VcorM_GR7B]|nr:hypothetical protein GR7B_00234 [Vibrio phage vB_VcorM_GR7B]